MLEAAKENLTKSFTPEQRERINEVLEPLTEFLLATIDTAVPAVKAMDKRPKQGWTPEQPEVFMPYVAQGMLEDLIEMLQAHV